MEQLSALTIPDFIIIAVIVISALISFARGFIRESLSLVAWLAALAAGFVFAPEVEPVLQPYIGDETFRYWAAVAAVFAVALILFGIINYIISRVVLQMGVSGTDRFAGLLLGIARGVVIVALALLAIRISPFDANEMWPDAVLIQHFQGIASWLWDVINAALASADLPQLQASEAEAADPTQLIVDELMQQTIEADQGSPETVADPGPAEPAAIDTESSPE